MPQPPGIDRWQQAGQTLLLHYSPFGGEHDHMARGHLGLWRNGREILPDLGTTGYGAPLHYGYYKHTASHNTLSINGSNQPPVTPQLLGHGQHGKVRWLTAARLDATGRTACQPLADRLGQRTLARDRLPAPGIVAAGCVN